MPGASTVGACSGSLQWEPTVGAFVQELCYYMYVRIIVFRFVHQHTESKHHFILASCWFQLGIIGSEDKLLVHLSTVEAELDDGQNVIEAIVVQQMTGVVVDRVRQRINDGQSDASFFVVSASPHSDHRTHQALEPVIMEVSHAEPAASISPSEALAMEQERLAQRVELNIGAQSEADVLPAGRLATHNLTFAHVARREERMDVL
jgi:hypothetical protein